MRVKVKAPFRIVQVDPKTNNGRLAWIEARLGRLWETIGQIQAGSLKVTVW